MLTLEMRLFIRLFELGTFAAVSDEEGISPSAVSRIMTRLETRLGVKLVHRSTRRLVFTPEGHVLLGYARQMTILADAAAADIYQKAGQVKGHLRVNCGTAFAHYKLAPILPEFLLRFPDVTIDVAVSDQRIDPMEEQIDVTIRVGSLQDSDLVVARLGTVKRIIAASPGYLERRGFPKTPADLKNHNCLLLTGFAGQALWPMISDGVVEKVAVSGSVSSDSADTLLKMAIAGVGIIRLGDFLGEPALADGRLIKLLEGQHDPDPKPLSALMLPGRQNIPRVRAFVDFLKEHV
jgi:DNA-binding transcriptional LysR family regulator